MSEAEAERDPDRPNDLDLAPGADGTIGVHRRVDHDMSPREPYQPRFTRDEEDGS